MIEDLWGEIELLEEEENRAIDIIREQATLIGKKTEGLVKGSFAKIEYTTIAKNQGMVSAMSALVNIAGSTATKTVEVDALSDRDNINDLYNKTSYKFELYNDVYKFRVFTLDYSEVFPIEIFIDEGICEELNLKRKEIISNNHEMEDVLRSVLSSYKVKLIVSRMMSKISTINKEKLINYIANNSDFTIAELADEMGWSKANATKRIKEVEKEGLIYKNEDGGKTYWTLKKQEKK